jgi:hypothetical protein
MKLMAALVAAVLLVPTAAWADNNNESQSRWGDTGSNSRRIDIQGIITSVDFQRGLIRVREENGRRWLVLVRADTEIAFENHDENDDEADFPTAGLAALQVGDMVGIKGLRLGNRRILALTLRVEGNGQGVGVLPSPQRVVRGVVVAISNRGFVLVLQERTVTVVVRSTTQFLAHQRPAAPWALAKYAVVQVRGEDLGDQILADAVEVEFASGEGVVLTGTVGGLWLPGGAFLLADRQVWFSFTSSTFVIQGQALVPLESVQPHASVVVYGVNRSPGVQAMVIVVR